MKKDIKLYNVLFPIWMLIVFPITWLIVLPANFIIDTLVVIITMKVLKVPNIKKAYKGSIIKVWLFGFASDFICAGLLLITQFIPGDWWYHNILSPVAFNPFNNPLSFLVVLIAIFISGLLIFLFNYKVSFKNTELSKEDIKKIAISMAIFTAPYVVLIPSKLLY